MMIIIIIAMPPSGGMATGMEWHYDSINVNIDNVNDDIMSCKIYNMT